MNNSVPYNTVATFFQNKDIDASKSTLQEIGAKCTRICEEYGATIGTIPHEDFGKINTYPEYIISKVIEEWAHH